MDMEKLAEVIARGLGASCRLGEEIETVDDLRNAEIDIGHIDLIALTAAILAEIKAQGYVIVPREPTEAMLDAYWSQTGESRAMRQRTHAYMQRYYAAMLSALEDQ